MLFADYSGSFQGLPDLHFLQPQWFPATPAPAPRRPAAPASYTVATGTHVGLANTEEISSRTAKAGQAFTATVRSDVKDAAGHVVIPAGSAVHGTIVEVKPGGANSAGTLTLAVNSVSVGGNSYPIEATIESAQTVRQGRGVDQERHV